MIVPLHSLKPTLKIAVQGLEPWLDKIYATFPVPSGKPKPLIQASVALTRNELTGDVEASGQLTFTPFVNCSRCAEFIPWPVTTDLNARFLNKAPPDGGVADLDEEALDEYYFQGDTLDIEPLLNERIQMAVPMQTIRLSDDKTSCLDCGLTVGDDRVYGDDTDRKPPSPFSVLAAVKVKQ